MLRIYLIGSLLLHLLLLLGSGWQHSQRVCWADRPAYFQLLAGSGLAQIPAAPPNPTVLTATSRDRITPLSYSESGTAPPTLPENEAASLVSVGSDPEGVINAAWNGASTTDYQGNILAPVPIYRPLPSYPHLARRNNWQGLVLLEAELRANGRIGQVRLVHSSGYALLDQEAIAAVKQWRYHPVYQAGRPVSGRLRIKIPFRLEG